MLSEIQYLLIKATEGHRVRWSDTQENPLCPYSYPTAVVKIGPIHYQIQMTGEKTGTFQIHNNDGVALGIFQNPLLATAVQNQVVANRKSAIFELTQQLAFMVNPLEKDPA